MSDNKRLAKHTFFLYIRMFMILIVSLYTSRVVLEVLGVVDFGVYSVVGGVVTMLTFLTNTMASASQRFFAFELGQGNDRKLHQLFNLTVLIYILFAFFIVIISETVGLYFVKNRLNIPKDRLEASVWVYQFSVASFVFTILRIPLNALIVAYERMSFYAWISIVEVVFKLVVVYLLVYFNYDKLIFYSILNFVVVVIITVLYQVYTSINFKHCKYFYYWNLTEFSRISSFATWNMFDSVANVAKNQGVIIVLSIFFNPIVNAARAIAFQVNTQITSFVGNIQVATAPQITKYYATQNLNDMIKLFFNSSKITFFIFFFIGLPFYFLAPDLLKIWLVNVPEYTIVFTRLVIINTLIDCLGGTSNLVIHAIGNVKLYKVVSGLLMFLNLPISYLFIKNGFSPNSTFIVSIVLSLIIVFARLLIIEKFVPDVFNGYVKNVLQINFLVFFVGSFFPFIFYKFFDKGILLSILLIIICFFSSLLSILFIGFTLEERNDFIKLLRNKFLNN